MSGQVATVQRTLAELETVIERGQQTFVEVGQALMEIRDGRLYREQGHPTFEDYCQRRWGWSRDAGYKYIAAAEVARNVDLSLHPNLTLTQARTLAPLAPAQQREIAERVDFSKTTVRELREEIQEMRQPKLEPTPKSQLPTVRPAMAVHFSSDSNEWYTPPEIVQRVTAALGGVDLDPCSNEGAPNVPAGSHYTAAVNGLEREWRGRVYMNPPYGRAIADWVSKLVAEYRAGNTTAAVALVPSRTDTDWFRQFRDCAVCFIDGRLRFSGQVNAAPFPSAAVYLGRDITAFHAAFADLGDIWLRYEVAE